MKKILFYTNQFFGQIGGEDMAYAEPQLFEGMHGSANTFGAPLRDIAEIVATIVCGDNFYAENMETGRAFLLELVYDGVEVPFLPTIYPHRRDGPRPC